MKLTAEPRKKKDFKLRESIVLEFERRAPSGKQTAIVEELLVRWVNEQRLNEQEQGIRRAYQKEKAKRER